MYIFLSYISPIHSVSVYFWIYLQDYEKALKYVEGILKVQPNNSQAVGLREEINKRMKKGNSNLVVLFSN